MKNKDAWRIGLVLAFGMALLPAFAELENVQVGGEVRIRGNYWRNTFNAGVTPFLVGRNIRWQPNALGGRSIGSFLGGQTIISHFDWDSFGNSYKVVEERTALRVQANFTDDVRAFIELDSFDVWGEDFRSDYRTAADFRTPTADDVEVYQSFIEADNMCGWPLRLRIGRQELVLGDGWLVGNNSTMPEFTYLSFDGIRLTYTFESGTVDAFATKLAERSPFEEDGDVDFYGLYGTWRANDALSLDAYWLWLRDARALNDTNLDLLSEWIEDAIGLDDYSVTNLHTVGLWASGVCQGFDYNAQVAYQFGDADAIGVLFSPFAYGDNGAEFDEWAADVEVGYTFEVMGWRPRVFLGGAYFGGEDNRDISFWEWLNPLAPWIRPESSVSFNRLFSNTVYSCLFDEMAELTNFVTARVGIEARPTECLETGLDLAYFRALETFDQPLHFWLWRFRVPILPRFSFLTDESDADLGWQLGLWMKYHYTDDLAFELGWQHLFTGDGLKDGNFTDLNGLLFNGGTDDQDADYFYIETALTF